MSVNVQCYRCKGYHGDDYLHTMTFVKLDGRLRPVCNRDCIGAKPEEKEPEEQPYIKEKPEVQKDPEQPSLF